MSDNELQQPRSNEAPPKRRRRPLVGYIIAGILGWLVVGTASVFVLAREVIDPHELAQLRAVIFAIGFPLGAGLYHFLWGTPIRFGLRTLLAGVSVAAVLCALGLYWEYLPGTFHFDRNGLPHGTGTRHYYYDSGALMSEEHYRAGVTTRTTWYKPNGEVIASTIWKKDQVNVGYFLYPDGSIRTKMEFRYDPESRMYLGDENRIDYAPDGTIEREFRDGKQISGD